MISKVSSQQGYHCVAELEKVYGGHPVTKGYVSKDLNFYVLVLTITRDIVIACVYVYSIRQNKVELEKIKGMVQRNTMYLKRMYEERNKVSNEESIDQFNLPLKTEDDVDNMETLLCEQAHEKCLVSDYFLLLPKSLMMTYMYLAQMIEMVL